MQLGGAIGVAAGTSDEKVAGMAEAKRARIAQGHLFIDPYLNVVLQGSRVGRQPIYQ
jgi:hypothetical protein